VIVPAFVQPLRHRRFRRVWIGQAVSAIGDGITFVALTGAVLAYHTSEELGLVLGAQSLSLVAVALFGGVIADRFRRSTVMAVADVVRLLCTLSLALGAAAGGLPPLIALALVLGLASGVFTPAFSAMIPDLVPDEDLGKANALRSITTRTGQIAGPGLGGLLLLVGSFSLAFWIDAATFAVSAFTLMRLGDAVPVRRAGETVFRQAREGFATVLRHRWVLTVILQGTIQLVVVMAPVLILLPIILEQRGDYEAYGLMVGLQAVGSVAGGMVIASWSPRRPGLIAVLGLGLLGLQLLALLTGASLSVLGAAMTATGFGYAVFGVLWANALQRNVPSEKLGRVFAIDTLGTYGLQPVGLALAPVAAAAFGNTATLGVGLVALAATTILPLLQRDVRRFADDSSEATPFVDAAASPAS
jgi:MFS family permease